MSDWAKKLASENTWVMHAPTETIAQAKTFYEAGTFNSKVNGTPVQSDVLEFSSGDSFVALREEDFIALTQNEAGFYVFAQRSLSELLLDMTRKSAVAKIPAETAIVILISVLRVQMSAMMNAKQTAG